MEKFLAARTHEIEWSGIRVMFALADEIPEVVNLGIGLPWYPVASLATMVRDIFVFHLQ
jgi:hypothetical protein